MSGASVKWKSWNLENFIEMANYLVQKNSIYFCSWSKRKKFRTQDINAFGKSKSLLVIIL